MTNEVSIPFEVTEVDAEGRIVGIRITSDPALYYCSHDPALWGDGTGACGHPAHQTPVARPVAQESYLQPMLQPLLRETGPTVEAREAIRAVIYAPLQVALRDAKPPRVKPWQRAAAREATTLVVNGSAYLMGHPFSLSESARRREYRTIAEDMANEWKPRGLPPC